MSLKTPVNNKRQIIVNFVWRLCFSCFHRAYRSSLADPRRPFVHMSSLCQRYFHERCARNRWSAAAGATWRVFVRKRCVVLFEFDTSEAPFALLFRWIFKHWCSKTVANMSRRRKVKSLTRFERVKTFSLSVLFLGSSPLAFSQTERYSAKHWLNRSFLDSSFCHHPNRHIFFRLR